MQRGIHSDAVPGKGYDLLWTGGKNGVDQRPENNIADFFLPVKPESDSFSKARRLVPSPFRCLFKEAGYLSNVLFQDMLPFTEKVNDCWRKV